jgi:hypothetical protein
MCPRDAQRKENAPRIVGLRLGDLIIERRASSRPIDEGSFSLA